MEFLTGRRPTGLDEENGLPITLSQLVEKALENGINGILQLIDPLLAPNISKNHGVVEDLLKLAVSCTCPVPEDRPRMEEILSSLSKLSKILLPPENNFLAKHKFEQGCSSGNKT